MITRHFIRVGERFVHYRCAGDGPPVVLLHQTPQSSASLEALIHLLATDCCAIAIDTPGFGQSDALPGNDWPIGDLAEALAQTLDALGVERAVLCGQHTGATIAAEFALRHPGRVCALALDGYTAFTAEERRTILPHQLYRFVPSWDGAHLVWAWSRFRDGWMFFPWSERRRAARRDLDMPSADFIQSNQIMELLRSRESHLAVYPGVFAWDGVEAARRLRVPALIAATADDQLFPHLDRLGETPPHVELLRLPNGARDALRAAQAAFVRRHAKGRAPAIADPTPAADGRLLAYANGLAVRGRHLDAAGDPLILLHGAGAAGEVELDAGEPGGRHPTYALDLPGHGDSGDAFLPAAAAAERVGAALAELGVARCRLQGRGLGAAVAVETALRRDVEVSRLDLHEVRLFADAERADLLANYAPPIEPRWDGTHLICLWHQLRDREFFFPWYRRTRDAIRPIEPTVGAERLTRLVFAALRCTDWGGAHAAWFDWPARRVALLRSPVAFHATPGDCWSRDLEALLPR